MSKRFLSIVASLLVLALLVGCGGSAKAPAPDVTLTVASGEKSVTLTWEELQALPAYEGPGGRISSVGKVTPPTTFKGVTIEDLCALVGGLSKENSVQITAKDGYQMTFSYDQIVTGNYDTYDPSDGTNKPYDGKLWTVIAYEEEGQPIPADRDGPLRMAILGTDKVVTDGHWWIKWVESIEVKAAQDEWTLHLQGVLSEEMDRGTFETGSSPSCHGTSWTDAEGQTWEGIPLWLLAGRVDDENKHESGAFNDDLAAAGYEIHLIASDGYSITLESAPIARNNKIFLAYRLNGAPLPEKYWPLRLVGPDLDKANWIGGVETIEIDLP